MESSLIEPGTAQGEASGPLPATPLRWRHLRPVSPRGRARRAASAGTTISLALVLLGLVLVGYGLFDNRWYHILVVQGGSMEPSIHWGDGVVIFRPPASLERGMVVTLDVDGQVVTHRVIQPEPLKTQGDANEAPDEWRPEQVRVAGIVRLRIPKLGWVLERLSLAGISRRSASWFRAQDTLSGVVEASAVFPGPESLPAAATLAPTESSTSDTHIGDPTAMTADSAPPISSEMTGTTSTSEPGMGPIVPSTEAPEGEVGPAPSPEEPTEPGTTGEVQLTEETGTTESAPPAGQAGPAPPPEEATNQ